jgi:hypothetical protein
MSFSLFKKVPSLSFVFDIRDSLIYIAVVNFENDKKPEIILCQDFPIEYQITDSHEKYTDIMIRTLDNAIISVRKNLVKAGNKRKIGTHYFFIGSPWSLSQSKTIKIVKDRPFEINDDLLKRIIIGEETSSEQKLESETSETNWKILEEKIIQSKLNGYRVNNIFGKKTANFAVELFISYIPYDVKNKLNSYIDEKVGRNTKRQNNSCTLSSYTFFRDIYSDKNDFIYVDIGKLITDVYVVRDDIIFGIASFPFGEENILKESLSQTSLSRDIFLSHLSIGNDKNFDLASHNKGEVLLNQGFEIWKGKLNEVLSKICTEMNIPNEMFTIPNSMISTILVDSLLKKDDVNKFEILGSKISVLSITENIFNSFILNATAFTNEPYIKMDIIFLDKMVKNNLQ